jgi:hypothetical protein
MKPNHNPTYKKDSDWMHYKRTQGTAFPLTEVALARGEEILSASARLPQRPALSLSVDS